MRVACSCSAPTFQSPVDRRFSLPPGITDQELNQHIKERIKTVVWIALGLAACHASVASAKITALGFFAGTMWNEKVASAAQRINTLLWHGGILSLLMASYLAMLTWPTILPPATFLLASTFGAYAYQQAVSAKTSDRLLPKSLQEVWELGHNCRSIYQEYYEYGLGVLSRLWCAAVPPQVD